MALITYSHDSYYSIAARRPAFEQTLAKYPEVRLTAVEKFTRPREMYQKTIRMLTANPGIKGIFAVWGDAAMLAIEGQQRGGARGHHRYDERSGSGYRSICRQRKDPPSARSHLTIWESQKPMGRFIAIR